MYIKWSALTHFVNGTRMSGGCVRSLEVVFGAGVANDIKLIQPDQIVSSTGKQGHDHHHKSDRTVRRSQTCCSHVGRDLAT